MPEATIRRAGPADAESLTDIGERTFVETFAHLYPPEDLAAYLSTAYTVAGARADLADPAKAMWIVEQDGEAVGYALAGPCGLPHPQVTAQCGELKRIYLLRRCQGGGLGGRLFKAVMDWLGEGGPRQAWIGVWSGNHGAQRFYARAGFEKAGEYDFHVGRVIDLEFILRRELPATVTR